MENQLEIPILYSRLTHLHRLHKLVASTVQTCCLQTLDGINLLSLLSYLKRRIIAVGSLIHKITDLEAKHSRFIFLTGYLGH